LAIELRQSKYLNNIVEQDRLAIKRITRSISDSRLSMRTHPDCHNGRQCISARGQLGDIKD
jgi:transposase-like protein